MFFMPETPRFLVRSGEEEEAREVLDEVTRTVTSAREKIEEIHEVEEEEGGVASAACSASRGSGRR